ncbi:unnamed protein product [Orchesella dallaii]|uniref:CRAL-TRIO domain-containing protein n=1 Tax=Orchesella dallaii TaxID=48710 RepID=A0ABP1PWE6_9HEXA
MGGMKYMGSFLWCAIFLYYVSVNTISVVGISAAQDLTLTPKELQALTKFREMVKPRLENEHDYMKSDIYLIRWLRAKNLNLRQAENMLMENLKWRKQYNIDGIHDEDWSDMFQDYPYTNDTFDLAGRPIGAFSLSDWDFRKAIASGKQVRLFRFMIKLLDEATNAVLRLQQEGKNVTQWKVLMNMEGFNLVQHGCGSCLPGFSYFVQAYENYYPGFADAIVTINTPSAFQVVLNLVRPVFTPQTRESLKVFGTNRAQWMAYLDKEISKDQRYPEYGGTRKPRF